MKNFAQLFSELESSNKTNDKIAALVNYFQSADEKDKIWCLALFTEKRPKRPVKTTLMREWAREVSAIPEWLFLECYSTVGDLGETLALLLPPPSHSHDKPLHKWMEEIKALQPLTDEEKKAYVIDAWAGLNTTERLIFNKLIGGSFRIGVSHKLLVNALAKYSGQDASALMHSIMGKWDVSSTGFTELINGETINADNSRPYPFCLAYPLEGEPEALGDITNWSAEYKWDGIRGQIVKRNNEIFIWSRGEELVTDQFPDLEEAVAGINHDFVADGEILIVKEGKVLNFNELQKRLNRKTVSTKMLRDLPAGFYAYDLTELDLKDIRHKPLTERRNKLKSFWPQTNQLLLSESLGFKSWSHLAEIRHHSREVNSEGLMLKRLDSPYHSGRKKGDWWKWKVDPMTIDAVLIYAQKGSGRRSAYYTDYTFAIRDADKLVTIAKAYSGLTDKEIMEITRFVRDNALEKFGPVRTVKPELVFEIAFEGIGYSPRHKSGVAVRFPRIARWRRDKTVDEIDTIESVKALIS
jgi:DNA ligase-1